jgi:hypothetical protein
MIPRVATIKRAWNAPRLVPHESLLLLSQSFLGLAPAGVQFDLLMLPGCSRSGNIPRKCP